MNVSECALCVDLVLLYIGTILYHASDVLNKVVFVNVSRKRKGDTQVFSLYLFIFEVFVFADSKISVNNPSLLFSKRKMTMKRLTTVQSVTMNCGVECSKSRVY